MTEFIIQVKKMRDAQKAYFKARRLNVPEVNGLLKTAQGHEAIVDKMLDNMVEPAQAQNLFHDN